MALVRILADGEESPCHKCGSRFKPGSMKVKRPSFKPGVPGTFTEGGKHYVWVHEKCAPTKAYYNGTKKKSRVS